MSAVRSLALQLYRYVNLMEKLYEMQPLTRFSSRAEDYARFRPDYSDEAISAIVEGMGNPERLTIVDVGAGTGISSRRLARTGAAIIAVEPNDEMRAAAQPHPNVVNLSGTAENIPVADASADVVACFQAFHWFRPETALREFRRVLKLQGRLAVVFNERDETDPFTREYGRIIRSFAKDHPAERRAETFDSRVAAPLFTIRGHAIFRFEQRLSREGLVGRARSASYLPGAGEELARLIESLQAFHDQWRDESGQVAIVYRTEVYTAVPASEV